MSLHTYAHCVIASISDHCGGGGSTCYKICHANGNKSIVNQSLNSVVPLPAMISLLVLPDDEDESSGQCCATV